MANTTDYEMIGYQLLNFAGTSALIGNRVFHGLIPETITTYPVINYFMVSSPNMWGQAERRRFQISCRDDNPGDVMELAFQVRRAFNNLQDSIDGFDVQNCWYDNSQFIPEDNGIYHIPVDIFVLYIRK